MLSSSLNRRPRGSIFGVKRLGDRQETRGSMPKLEGARPAPLAEPAITPAVLGVSLCVLECNEGPASAMLARSRRAGRTLTPLPGPVSRDLGVLRLSVPSPRWWTPRMHRNPQLSRPYLANHKKTHTHLFPVRAPTCQEPSGPFPGFPGAAPPSHPAPYSLPGVLDLLSSVCLENPSAR